MNRLPKPPRPEDWRKTNPRYERSAPQTGRLNGMEVVVIDAGTWWDYARDQRALAKGKKA